MPAGLHRGGPLCTCVAKNAPWLAGSTSSPLSQPVTVARPARMSARMNASIGGDAGSPVRSPQLAANSTSTNESGARGASLTALVAGLHAPPRHTVDGRAHRAVAEVRVAASARRAATITAARVERSSVRKTVRLPWGLRAVEGCSRSLPRPFFTFKIGSGERSSDGLWYFRLLRTKGRDRIDAHRTTRRNQARDRHHEHEDADDAA